MCCRDKINQYWDPRFLLWRHNSRRKKPSFRHCSRPFCRFAAFTDNGRDPISNPSGVGEPLTRGPGWATLGHMSAIAKSRIDPELKRQAEAVLEEIGLKPRAALELFYKQIIKRRAIPFPVQADSPEDEVLSPADRRNALADEF